jgi:hypothetical protein
MFARSETPCWRTTMAKKRKARKATAEGRARYEETTRLIQERIAYHERRAREEEARAERRAS